MQMLKSSLAATLAFSVACAMAQVIAPPDPKCPLPGAPAAAAPAAQAALSTPIGVFTVKSNSPKPCIGGECQMEVEVQSYTNSRGAQACCVRAEYRSFDVAKSTKSAVLRWNLKAVDKESYLFNPGNGVFIISPPTLPTDFGQPAIDPLGQWYAVPSFNARSQSFNYGFTIYRKNQNSTYLACDPNDPVIVNQGP